MWTSTWKNTVALINPTFDGSRISQRREPTPERTPTYYLANFSWKLHKNEDILGRGASLARPLDPPLLATTKTTVILINHDNWDALGVNESLLHRTIFFLIARLMLLSVAFGDLSEMDRKWRNWAFRNCFESSNITYNRYMHNFDSCVTTNGRWIKPLNCRSRQRVMCAPSKAFHRKGYSHE